MQRSLGLSWRTARLTPSELFAGEATMRSFGMEVGAARAEASIARKVSVVRILDVMADRVAGAPFL